jgi:hypothetical protein
MQVAADRKKMTRKRRTRVRMKATTNLTIKMATPTRTIMRMKILKMMKMKKTRRLMKVVWVKSTTRKRKAPWPVMTNENPKKRTKPAVQRISILLRGRETGMGEIPPEPQAGYLEFVDDLFSHFKGKVDLPYIGSAVEIEGFKIAPRAKRAAEPWENFSEKAYEYARVARWR